MRYIYVALETETSASVHLESTDPDTLDWILNQVKTIVPSAEAGDAQYDATGAVSACRLRRLQNKDRAVAYWVKRLLCDNGFEPFALAHAGAAAGMWLCAVHFRKAVEQ
jgi:hypothetical protein